MAQLHERELLGLKSIETIMPAQGEEKKRLEAECEKYLQDPDKTTASDFLNFIPNMIALIGGKREKIGSGAIVTSSLPLLDQENQTVIFFEITKNADKATSADIGINSLDKQEKLTVYLSRPNEPAAPYFMNTLCRELPKFDSYITGKSEVVDGKGWYGAGILLPSAIEVKGFARKVFGVYQRQGQQLQPQHDQPPLP